MYIILYNVIIFIIIIINIIETRRRYEITDDKIYSIV